MSYRIEPRDRFTQTFCVLPEIEIRPGPTVTFKSEVDLTEVEAIRARERCKDGSKYSYTAFVVKALALGLKEFPFANRRVFRQPWLPFLGPRIQAFEACDIAMAVERDKPGQESLAFVGVLRDVDQLSLEGIMEGIRHLRDENNPEWLQFTKAIAQMPYWLATFVASRLPCWLPKLWVQWRGAAAMVTSPAKYGVDNVLASWAWPVGMSFGYVEPRPLVREGQVVVRPTVHLVLNFDRRVMAGAPAARFFDRIVDILVHAETEMAPFLQRADQRQQPNRPAPTGS